MPELLRLISSPSTARRRRVVGTVHEHLQRNVATRRAIGERVHLVGAQGQSFEVVRSPASARRPAAVVAHWKGPYNTTVRVNRIALVMHTTSYGAPGFVEACRRAGSGRGARVGSLSRAGSRLAMARRFVGHRFQRSRRGSGGDRGGGSARRADLGRPARRRRAAGEGRGRGGAPAGPPRERARGDGLRGEQALDARAAGGRSEPSRLCHSRRRCRSRVSSRSLADRSGRGGGADRRAGGRRLSVRRQAADAVGQPRRDARRRPDLAGGGDRAARTPARRPRRATSGSGGGRANPR